MYFVYKLFDKKTIFGYCVGECYFKSLFKFSSMETLNQFILEIRDNMSLSLMIFDMVVVITVTLILCSNWAPALLGGEWFTYKVKDKVTKSSYVLRTQKEKTSNAMYEYELDSGPIYEGTNKLIHVIALIVLSYFSFWSIVFAWLGIWYISYFAPLTYFWYSGGFWQNVYEYNTDYDRWNNIGPTKAKDSKKLKVRNYGMQKWIIYYSIFFVIIIYADIVYPDVFQFQSFVFALSFLLFHLILHSVLSLKEAFVKIKI